MQAGHARRHTIGTGLLWVALGILGGCGGGGGEGGDTGADAGVGVAPPPVTSINTGNADGVASRSYAMVGGMFGAIDAATAQLKSADANRPPLSPVRLSITAMQWADGGLPSAQAAAGSAVVSKAVRSATEACPAGGRIVGVADDANDDGVLNAGDSVRMTFERCVVEGNVVNGSIAFVLEARASTAASVTTDAVYTFSHLSTTSGGATSTINGDMRLRATISTASPVMVDLEVSGSRLESSESGQTRVLTSYSGRASFDDARRTISYAVWGKAAGTDLPGMLSLEMPSAFVRTNDAEPTAGALRVTGSDGSALRVTASPPAGVQLWLDTDGDGAAESTRALSWAQLGAR
jgi:hypothetical protein